MELSLSRLKFVTWLIASAVVVLSLDDAFAAGFPVNIDNAFGTTRVPAKPHRVVSIGYVEQDFLYALGVAPVAVRNWWGNYAYATWSWAEPARAALDAKPEVFSGDQIDLEWVLKQNPDLIVGTFVEMDQDKYDALSKIAPVVSLPKGYAPWSAPWQVELRDIDTATSGDASKADKIIADLDAKYAAVRASYPQFAGKNGTVLYYADGNFTLFGEKDPASRFLIDLGLAFPPAFAGKGDPENNIINVSGENLRDLDFDVAVWPPSPGAPSARATVEAMPLYQQIKLGKGHHSLWLDNDNGVLAGALTFQSPLAIDYLLDTLPPLLAKAIDGTP